MLDLASGVSRLCGVDRLLICSGDDRKHHTGGDVKGVMAHVVRLLALGFVWYQKRQQHLESEKCIDQLVTITEYRQRQLSFMRFFVARYEIMELY